jgi:virginiamycin A acetyltransferase
LKLDADSIAELYKREFDLRWTRLFGTIKLEAPVNITNMTVFGSCSAGAFTYTNHDCEIFSTDIGRYCSIGQNTTINPGVHPTDFLTTHPIGSSLDAGVAGMKDFPSFISAAMTQMDRPSRMRGGGRVKVEHDVWIGAGAIIMEGVTIHTGAIVGAGAVVTRDVAPFSIVAGAPARVIRERFAPDVQQRILNSRWWDYDLSRMPRRNFSNIEMFLTDLETFAPPRIVPDQVQLE